MLIYDVAFSAETDDLKKQLAVLKKEVDDIFRLDKSGIRPEAMFDPIKTEGRAAAQFLQQALQKATSIDGVSLSRFNTELAKSGVSAEKLAQTLGKAGMTNNFTALATTIASADSKLTVFNDHIKEMHRVLTQSVKFRAAMGVQDFLVGQAQAAVQWTKALNQNLVDIQVVSEKSAIQMEKVFDTVITKSKELSTTAKDYSAAALIYYQQGLADEEVARRTEITVKAARAAGEDAEAMSQNLTAIWNTYQMTGDRLQNAASIAAKLGADTAVDFAYIAEAMQTSALGAAQMGLSYENLAAIIATVGETTMQTASVVGNAYKTILTRFDQLKTTGTDGEITLGRISQQLQDLGIHILDASGELKSMDQIIYETGDAWQTYSQKQQIAVAQVLGGVRQFPQVLALFNNWEKFLTNADSAFSEMGSGTLEEQFRVASESIAVYADQAAEAWQRAFGEIANEDLLKDFYGILKDTGDAVGTIIDAFGGLPGILAIIGVAFSKNILDKIGQGGKMLAANLTNNFSAMGRRLSGEQGITGAMVGQQATGARIAEYQTGAEQRGTNRSFETDTLRYYQQLNDQIRTGSDLQKAVAQAEKERFTALLTQIQEADASMTKLQTDIQAGAQVGTRENRSINRVADAVVTELPIEGKLTPESVEKINDELKMLFGKNTTLPINIDTDNATQQLNKLASQMQVLQETDMDAMQTEIDETTTKIKNQERAVKSLETQMKKAKGKPGEDKAAKSYDEAAKKLDVYNKKLKELQQTQKDVTKVQNMSESSVANFKQSAAAADEYSQKLEQLRQKQEALGAAKFTVPSFTETIAGVGQLVTGLGMLANSIQNLTDGEGDFGQELISAIIQLSFIVPMAIKGFTSLHAAMSAGIAVRTAYAASQKMNTLLQGQEVTAATVLAAAKQAGIAIDEQAVMVNGEVNASLLSKALANKGVTVSEAAMTGATAANTPVAAANAAVWWTHPVVLILAVVLLAAVAAFALLTSAAKKNADAARESAQRSQEQAQAFNDVQAAVTSASEALDDNEAALNNSTKGTEKHNEAIKATEKTFEDIRTEIEKLGIDDLNLDILRNAEAWAIATGDMRSYREELENVQKRIEQDRLREAEFAVGDNLYSAQENWKGGAFLNGSQVFSGHTFGTSDIDKRLIEALKSSDAYGGAVSGYGTSLTGSVGIYLDIDWDDPEQFIEDYESLQELLNTWYDTASGGEKSDLISGLRDRLDSIKGEYENVRSNLDAIRAIEGNRVYERGVKDEIVRDRSAVTTVQEYEAAVNELASAYERVGYTADEAMSRARSQYRYFATENSELGRQLKELQAGYEAIQAAMDRGTRFGVNRQDMKDVYQWYTDPAFTEAEHRTDEEKRRIGQFGDAFPRIDFRGYTGGDSSDLFNFVDEEIDRISSSDLVIKTRLEIQDTLEGIETLKNEGAEAVREMFDWGPYINAIGNEMDSSYSFFLDMSAEQQEEYLRTMAENQIKTMHQALLDEQKALMQSIPAPNVRDMNGEFMIDPQLEEYRAEIDRLWAENEINIKLNFLADATMSQTVDELTNKLLEGRIEAEQFEQALDGVFMTEAESFGFDGEEMLAFASHIQEVAVGSDLLSDHLATNKKDAMEAALSIARLNRGIDNLAGGFKDWNDVLKKSDRASQEYFEALQGMKEAMADVLNIDAKDMSSKFIEDNLETIEKASKGSVEALAELQLAAGEDIVLQFLATVDTSAATEQLVTDLNAIQEYINTIPIEIRADLPDDMAGKLGELGQAFIDTAMDAGMAAEDIAAALQAMGYNARVVTTYEEQEISVPVYTEYSTMATSNAAEYDEHGTMTSPPTWQRDTYTVHSGNKTMMGMVPVTSVEIDGMSGSFGGNISNYSSVNKGGPPPGGNKGGGGGGKPKAQENLKSTNNDQRFNYLNNLLDLYGKIEFYGQKEVARLEKEAELQKEIVDAVQTRADLAINTRDEAMEGMEQYGAIFEVDANGLSYIKNLEEIVAKYGDTNEELGEAFKVYTEAEGKLIDARKDLADQQQAYLDKMLAAALSLNKQTTNYQERAIKIAESWQSSYIRGARILTDAAGNLYGEMSNLSDKMYAGAARLLTMYFEKDVAMLTNFHKNIDLYTSRWAEIQNNNALAETMGWDYAIDGNQADRAALLEEMHEVQDGLMATLESLYAHNEQVWSNFHDIIDGWEDHMDVIYGKFDNLKSVAETMLDIAKRTGTAMFTPEQRKTLLTLQKTQISINKEQVAAAKTRMDLEQNILDQQRAEVERFIADRDRTFGGISDDEFARQLIQLNEMTEKMEENLQNATDEYWSAFKGSVEDAWDYYEAYGEEIIYRMKYNLATGSGFAGSAAEGSWSFLGQMMEFQDEILDRSLNPGSQVRQTTELIRELEKFDMDQVETMGIYNDLMSDLLAAKNMEVELTEYDYQILVERFNLLKAQAAFEDAREAKNTMRLARDASGNWSYIYSADPEKTDDKTKEVEDSLNKIYELSYDRIRELVNEFYGIPDAMAAALGALDPNDPKHQEQVIKIREYYTERANWLIQQIDNAEMNSANVMNLVVQSKITDLEYLQSIQNLGKLTVEDLYGTELGWLLRSAEGNQHFRDVIEETTDDQIENWNALQDNINDCFVAAGQDINTFQKDWAEKAKQIGGDAQNVGKQFTDTATAMSNAISTMITQQGEWADSMVKEAARMVDAIRTVLDAIQTLEGQKLGYGVDSSTGNIYRTGDIAAEMGRMIEAQNISKHGGENSAAALADIVNTVAFQQLIKERDMKIEAQGLKGEVPATQTLIDLINKGAIGWDNGFNSWVYWSSELHKRVAISFDDLMKMATSSWRPPNFTAFATGGFVPSANGIVNNSADTIPGMLTPAEYVLNPEDTQAFFKTFQQFLAIPNLGQDILKTLGQDALQQLVQIQADFPNVSSRDEIQAALNNLINQAKQYNV